MYNEKVSTKCKMSFYCNWLSTKIFMKKKYTYTHVIKAFNNNDPMFRVVKQEFIFYFTTLFWRRRRLV